MERKTTKRATKRKGKALTARGTSSAVDTAYRSIAEILRTARITAYQVVDVKDPDALDFLGLKENPSLLETDLEQALMDRLQAFLLELGRGFAFVARQKRITVGGDHYYIDLVFYNYLLKCFALIDVKTGKLAHQDIGQMDFYVRYFEAEEKAPEDGPVIGLILCSDKNEAMVKYTLLADRRGIFASKCTGFTYRPKKSYSANCNESGRRSSEKRDC